MTVWLLHPGSSSRITPVEHQQLAQCVVFGDVRGPAVGYRDGGIKCRVGVGEPLRAGVVEVGQGAFLQLFPRRLVSGDRPLRIAGGRLVHPLHPFRRIEPSVAQLDQSPRGSGDGGGTRVIRSVGGRNVGRESIREREGFECGSRRVAGAVFQARPQPQRPRLVKPAVQNAERHIVVAGRQR